MNRPSLRIPLGVCLLALSGMACSSQGPSSAACTGSVTVIVGPGTEPTMSWVPRCALEEVLVALPGPGAVAWAVESSSQTNTIVPPIHYGVTPAGAQQLVAPGALVSGTSYDVSLLRFDDGHGGSLQPAGSTSFTP
jgi:hypothetical protein